MKHKLLTALFAIALTSLKSQVYYMCSGQNSSTANNGIIYDSGGPNGDYSSYENCLFLISSGCVGNNITLSFNSFATELNYDFLTVYNGSTTAAPILANYNGVGTAPTLVATSGFMLLRFTSDGSYELGGFSANWSFSSNGCAPVSNFSFTTNSCQGRANFVNTSSNSPNTWLWNFGDGTGSTLPNPVHVYTTPGTYPVTLVVSNSMGSSTITKSVTVNPIVFNIGYNGAPLMNSAMSFTTDNTTSQVYTWNFGDGSIGGTANAIHTYTAMGSYTVALTIASGSCVTTSTMLVNINNGVGIEQFYGPQFNASIQPNPSFGDTHLNLQLASDGPIKIELVNQLGQLIKVIADTKLEAGQYDFKIEAVPAGVYYVNIKEGAKGRTLKMISSQ